MKYTRAYTRRTVHMYYYFATLYCMDGWFSTNNRKWRHVCVTWPDVCRITLWAFINLTALALGTIVNTVAAAEELWTRKSEMKMDKWHTTGHRKPEDYKSRCKRLSQMEWKESKSLATLWRTPNNRLQDNMLPVTLTEFASHPDVCFLSVFHSVYIHTRIRLTTVTYLDTSVVLPANGEQVHVSSFRLAVSLQYINRTRK